MNTLLEGLVSYGLREDEASVYLLCLEEWAVTAGDIAQRTSISVAQSASVIKDLIHRGILVESDRHSWPDNTYYQAVSPELLFANLQQRFQRFWSVLPDLIGLSATLGIKPKIKIAEWIEWIKHVYNDTLHSQTEILAFLGNHVATPEVMSWLYDEYVPARVQKNIYAKVILSSSTANREYQQNDYRYHRESRMLPDASINFWCEICLYDQSKIMIAFYHASDMCGILIESERLHETLTWIFTYMRSTLK